MKRLLLVSGLLLMVNTLLQADSYLLVMSKDDKLCQNITTMFNEDLFKHKEVRLKDHKEFNAVVWDKEFEFFDYPNDKRITKPRCDNEQSLGCKNAIFDINNDGKEELVAFMDERLYGVASYNEIQWVAQDLNAPLEFHYVKRLQSLGGGITSTKNFQYKELPKMVSNFISLPVHLFYSVRLKLPIPFTLRHFSIRMEEIIGMLMNITVKT